MVKYLYDGSQCIAEYDGSDNLPRKYVYGSGIDQPRSTSLRAGSSCMVGVEDSGPALSLSNGAVSYYHYGGLGSVVALSDEDGETIQVYEYDVYGNVAASDPNHPNPFTFTGRRFDAETGLYFYRARYYNPALGRFLQTDPIGYGDGMNVYAYCHNNPLNMGDPIGTKAYEHDGTYDVNEDAIVSLDPNCPYGEAYEQWQVVGTKNAIKGDSLATEEKKLPLPRGCQGNTKGTVTMVKVMLFDIATGHVARLKKWTRVRPRQLATSMRNAQTASRKKKNKWTRITTASEGGWAKKATTARMHVLHRGVGK